jgi:predicted DNA-binding transcriptional regulator YafY
VTERTLRRDVDRLRSLGYPIKSTSGTGGGYQLAAGAHLPPLLLDDEEAVAVAVGLRTAASGTVTGMEEASLRALSKLEQVLPERLRSRVGTLHSFIVSVANKGPTVDPAMLSLLAGACRDNHGVRFNYRSRSGAATERAVEPHRLVHTGRRWYLAAWDVDREDWRTFRVDRIEPSPAITQRFTPRTPPDGDVAAYVSRSVSYSPYPYRAKVILEAPVDAVTERVPPTIGALEAIDERRCRLQTGAQSLDMLSIYLGLIGVEFEVEEPAELVEHIRGVAQRLQRSVG